MVDLFKWFLIALIAASAVTAIWLDCSAARKERDKRQAELIQEMMEKQFRDRMAIRQIWVEKQFWISEAIRLKKG